MADGPLPRPLPAPPPGPPPNPSRSRPGQYVANVAKMTAAESALAPYSISGHTKEDQAFEFHDQQDGTGRVYLQPIIRHYLGVPRARLVPAADMYKILGRLRSLQYTIANYNEGIVSSTPAFLQYWRQRTLNLLSGFGFRVGRLEQAIHVP